MAETLDAFAPSTLAREKIHDVASVYNLWSVQTICNGGSRLEYVYGSGNAVICFYDLGA
jgi:hypothetical protein